MRTLARMVGHASIFVVYLFLAILFSALAAFGWWVVIEIIPGVNVFGGMAALIAVIAVPFVGLAWAVRNFRRYLADERDDRALAAAWSRT
jgi:hypothetical protein